MSHFLLFTLPCLTGQRPVEPAPVPWNRAYSRHELISSLNRINHVERRRRFVLKQSYFSTKSNHHQTVFMIITRNCVQLWNTAYKSITNLTSAVSPRGSQLLPTENFVPLNLLPCVLSGCLCRNFFFSILQKNLQKIKKRDLQKNLQKRNAMSHFFTPYFAHFFHFFLKEWQGSGEMCSRMSPNIPFIKLESRLRPEMS